MAGLVLFLLSLVVAAGAALLERLFHRPVLLPVLWYEMQLFWIAGFSWLARLLYGRVIERSP